MPLLWDRLSQGFSYLIILASTIMLGWGLLGFLEYFTGLAPLMPLQNSTFPVGMQTLHWILITASGATFLAGYFMRWSFTPIAMLVMFTALATMCAVQTFDMLETPDRYRNFVQECINYIVISFTSSAPGACAIGSGGSQSKQQTDPHA